MNERKAYKARLNPLLLGLLWIGLAALPTGAWAQADDDQIRELKREFDAKIQKLNNKIEELQDQQALTQMEDDYGPEGGESLRIFKIHGFFDLTFNKYFFPEDSLSHGALPDKSSFMMTNINLYIVSQMTNTLSALLELRFMFLPHGNENDFPVVLNGMAVPEYIYDRTDTTVYDYRTTELITPGGLLIERAHLTWAPADWFKFLAGHYLTPYGIWNVDHGTPVLLPIRPPYLQIRQMVPPVQTGIQIYGSFFTGSRFPVDYAITVSNGRGPMESVVDIDENKGVGLKLKFNYDSNDVVVALGGYGYYGEYSDRYKEVHVDTSSDDVWFEVLETQKYREIIGSADFLLDLFGLRLQAEYVRRYVFYDQPAEATYMEKLFLTDDVMGTYYTANFIGQGVYVLLAWQLPLDNIIAPVTITPYVLGEYNASNDMINMWNINMFLWGINVVPSPYVVLKIESGWGETQSENQDEYLWNVAAQIAVSF